MTLKRPYLSKKLFEFCCELIDKVLNFDQSTSSAIHYYVRSKGKKFGPVERELIVNIIFSIVRNKSYFKSIIDIEKNNLPNIKESKYLIILGSFSVLDKKSVVPLLIDEEKFFLEKLKIKSVKEIFIEFRESNFLNEKLSVPSWIFKDWVDQRGLKKTINFIESNHANYPIYCRVNLLKNKVSTVLSKILQSGYFVEQSNVLEECLKFLPGENINRIMALFPRGVMEVQDLGSQLVAKLVSPKRHEVILDICAGTGGKSLALSAKMKNTGKIFSIDVSANRILQLKNRLLNSKSTNIWPMVIESLEDKRLKKFYGKVDSVLVDAPCSGLGTLRRNPELKWRASQEQIKNKKKLQLEILKKAGLFCKLGGHLVYATCSTIYDENEAVIEEFLSSNSYFRRCNNKLVFEIQNIILDKTWNVYDSCGNIHLWSDLTDTDSFFMTRLIRINK